MPRGSQKTGAQERLARYRAKRSADRTPEPFGGEAVPRRLLARVLASRLPEVATTIRAPGDRGGRVYVDLLQNGHGKLLAAPFTARPVPGALASAPLLWDEVDDNLDPRAFSIRTLPDRMRSFDRDPLVRVLTQAPDPQQALGRLASRLV